MNTPSLDQSEGIVILAVAALVGFALYKAYSVGGSAVASVSKSVGTVTDAVKNAVSNPGVAYTPTADDITPAYYPQIGQFFTDTYEKLTNTYDVPSSSTPLSSSDVAALYSDYGYTGSTKVIQNPSAITGGASGSW